MQYVLTVSEVNRYIRDIISRDLVLSNLWVKGEISNFKCHYTGHLYFTIKDEKSLLKCVMFKSHADGLKFAPENGMKVIIRGYVSVFERDGQYQLYAEEMQPDGVGSLHVAFEQLKKKLQSEGLFDAAHKKKLPLLPGNIGVITSITGAVIRDILNVLGRRFPNFRLSIYPVQVQGEVAPGQIARAIKKLNELGCVDVIILARGGGSMEELWAFNDEMVARSIYESDIPVISAVGHETDFTIADFVADLRAPTPSAAAELVLPDKQSLKYQLASLKARLDNALRKSVRDKRQKLERLMDRTPFRQPFNIVYQNRMKLDVLAKYLHKAMMAREERYKSCLAGLVGRLDALSPLKTITRGYSIVKSTRSGRLVKSVNDVCKGEILEVNVIDGKIICGVNDVEGGKASE